MRKQKNNYKELLKAHEEMNRTQRLSLYLNVTLCKTEDEELACHMAMELEKNFEFLSRQCRDFAKVVNRFYIPPLLGMGIVLHQILGFENDKARSFMHQLMGYDKLEVDEFRASVYDQAIVEKGYSPEFAEKLCDYMIMLRD